MRFELGWLDYRGIRWKRDLGIAPEAGWMREDGMQGDYFDNEMIILC